MSLMPPPTLFVMQFMLYMLHNLGLDAGKPVFRGFVNNKGADQPAHPHRLISAFVIHVLESIISKLATSEIFIFELISVAEETGLNLALMETLKTGFVATRPIWFM